MWAEIILPRDDLARLLGQALPLTIHLGDAEKEHSLSLTDLSEVTLVADLGLRVTCKARVRWPLLGIDVPIEVRSLTLVLLPAVQQGEGGDALVFRASIEDVDFSALPALLDDGITTAINAKLAAKGAALSWNFTKSLTYLVPLPTSLGPLESFAIRPAWGKVRITSDAIVYAASFHSSLIRRGESPPVDDAAPLASLTPTAEPVAVPAAPALKLWGLAPPQLVAAGVLVASTGLAYLFLRRALRS